MHIIQHNIEIQMQIKVGSLKCCQAYVCVAL